MTMTPAAPSRDCPSNDPRKTHRNAFARFASDESGAMMVFMLFLLILLLGVGGLAVDLMRTEKLRTAIAQTDDRAVLAAASLSNTLPPKDVVKDYFAKAGLLQYLVGEPVVESGVNFRTVKAAASVTVIPFFGKFFGLETLSADAVSSAEQRLSKVEISLVLDISRSMIVTTDQYGNETPNQKLVNLKSAAKKFVDTVLKNDSANLISISLVPYNGQVNLGPTLRGLYNETYVHGQANVDCLDLPPSVYVGSGMSTLSRSLAIPMTAHADIFSGTYTTIDSDGSGQYTPIGSLAIPGELNRWCPPVATNIVRVHSNNISTLTSQIDGLVGIGATSINAGMKWGLTFLDPDSRPVVAAMVGGSSPFAARPIAYSDPEVLKVIVLMTDGSHFAEVRMNDEFRAGNSTIFRSKVDGLLSIYHATKSGANKYWWPHVDGPDANNIAGDGDWKNAPYNKVTGSGAAANLESNLPWVTVWKDYRASYVVWQLYARALGTNSSTRSSTYTTWMDKFRSGPDTAAETNAIIAQMDTELQSLCTRARELKIVVFGVAFEAPPAGQKQILDCSTAPDKYQDAAGKGIETAFSAIASQISLLRLTQ